MSTLKQQIVLKVRENSYNISQPNIGQMIDIEMLKAQITNGNYGKMISNLSKASIFSLDMVDMFAHFRVLCPELLEDLKVNNWTELGGFDTLDIYKAYAKDLRPWYNEYSDSLMKVWQDITDSLITEDVGEKQSDKDVDSDGRSKE